MRGDSFMAHQVFISYSNKDKIIADALCHRLEENGIRCWIAPRDIAAGDSWAESIANAIPASGALVLIFSASANKSKQVVREVELAINNDIVLIPLRIEDVTPTGSMSYYLATMHWIDAVDRKMESKFGIISERIISLLGLEAKQKEPETLRTQGKQEPKAKRKRLTAPKIIAIALAAAAVVAAAILLPKMFSDGAFTEDQSAALEAAAADADALDVSSEAYSADDMLSPEDLGYDPDSVIKVGDDALEEALTAALGDIRGDTEGGITIGDMFQLETLAISRLDEDAFDNDFVQEQTGGCEVCYPSGMIADLDALEYAANLKNLILIGYAGFEDSGLWPIWNLDNLEMLFLYDDGIVNINGVEKLSQLTILSLGNNQIDDVEPIRGMDNLKYLDLSNNSIDDIGALSGLTNLHQLWISENQIDDISALENLTQLDCVCLTGNPVADIDALSGLYRLEELYLSEESIDDLSPLTELYGLTWLSLDGNWENDIAELTYIHNPKFYGYDPDMDVEIEDQTLRNIVETTLENMGENVDGGITVEQMFKIETIAASQFSEDRIPVSSIKENSDDCDILYVTTNMRNLDGLEYAVNLKNLILIGYGFSNGSGLEPLSQLERLEMLYLHADDISDISPLEGLGSLKYLVLLGNHISDIGAIHDMPDLWYLDLAENNISDLSALSGLPSLSRIILRNNPVGDLSPLVDLDSLVYLELDGADGNDIDLLADFN